MNRLIACCVLLFGATASSIVSAQTVVYYPPAPQYVPAMAVPPPVMAAPVMAAPTVVARVPVMTAPVTTYYAPQGPLEALFSPLRPAPVVTYYAPVAGAAVPVAPMYAVPPVGTASTSYSSSVSSMPLTNSSVPTVLGMGTPNFVYRPVVAAPMVAVPPPPPTGYLYTRGFLGRPQVVPVPVAPVAPIYAP